MTGAFIYRSLIRIKTVALVLLVTSLNKEVIAQDLRYYGGVSYTSGSYFFSERTGSFYLNNGVYARYGRLSLSANIPFVVQSTQWVSYSPYGSIPTGGGENSEVRRVGMGTGTGHGHGGGRQRMVNLADTVSYSRSGFSDPSFQAGLMVYSDKDRKTSVSVNSQVKLPFTNPSSGFGTGKWDVSAGLSAAQVIWGSWMLLADASWWWLGDMDELELNNVLAFSAGIGKLIPAKSWMINASVMGSTAIIDNFDPPLSLAFGAGYIISPRVILNANTTFGLSESSAGFSAGFGWSIAI